MKEPPKREDCSPPVQKAGNFFPCGHIVLGNSHQAYAPPSEAGERTKRKTVCQWCYTKTGEERKHTGWDVDRYGKRWVP